MTRLDGIDVSHYQGIVDWEIVRASCARPDHAVAVWKVTQGIKTLDPTAERNRDDTAAAGFRWRLGYHWLSPKTDPIGQARWFLSHFGGISPGEGVIVDAEEPGITADQVLAFCQAVEGTTGRPVAVYTGVHVAGGSIWRDTRIFNGERIRWVAAYVPETRVRKACEPFGFDVWQWSSSGTVPGVVTRCDVNMIEHPIMLDMACAVHTPIPTPVPPPLPASAGATSFGGKQMLVVVACSDNKNDPQRWVWNGIVRHHITNEAEYNSLVTAGLVNPKWTLATPMWMTLLQLAAIPLV